MSPSKKVKTDFGGSNTPLNVRDMWNTPQEIFDYFNSIYKYDFDGAASYKSYKCASYFTIDDDSLNKDWSTYGSSFWVNPPYSNMKPWFEHANNMKDKGVLSTWFVPNTPDSGWFQEALKGATKIYFITSGRISFIREDTGNKQGGNTKGSCLIEFDPKVEANGQPQTVYITREEIYDFSLNQRINNLK